MTYALDIESETLVKTDKPYALEPWRVGQSLARISCFTLADEKGESSTFVREAVPSALRTQLRLLEGHTVVCHNALFDVAWIYATIMDYDLIRKIDWVDSMLLSKWLTNNNNRSKHISNSLINVCNRYIPDHPDMEEFNDVKSQKVTPGEDFEYWLKRNVLDTKMTLAVYMAMMKLLPASSLNGYNIEQDCIAPIAKGWVHGIPFDDQYARDLDIKVQKMKVSLCKELGVPVGLLTSPKQKKDLIFGTWGMKPSKLTPTGAPSTSHEVLMRLHQQTKDPRFDQLMAAVKLSTIQAKYLNGFERTLEYVGEPVLHGCPKIFGTYTGRMTYGGKTLDKQKFQCSIALHQISRKAKSVNHTMKAPPGMGIIKVDANSQEVRFMAIQANEQVMIEAYNNKMDLHSVMTQSITGRPYDEIVNGNKSGISDIVEDRQAGKLLNLSCSYRIKERSLMEKFFDTYEKDISYSTAMRYLILYKTTYPGVPEYWLTAIAKAKRDGYAETIAGRRCHIDQFDWVGESSAINFPIQGSGGDHKYATISIINATYPELILALDMHDGIYYFCDLDTIEETTLGIIDITKGCLYEDTWNTELPITLPFDGQFSRTSFAEFGDEL